MVIKAVIVLEKIQSACYLPESRGARALFGLILELKACLRVR